MSIPHRLIACTYTMAVPSPAFLLPLRSCKGSWHLQFLMGLKVNAKTSDLFPREAQYRVSSRSVSNIILPGENILHK